MVLIRRNFDQKAEILKSVDKIIMGYVYGMMYDFT